MKIGDIVQRIPETFGETETMKVKDGRRPKKTERKPFTGTVTYIHPLRRTTSSASGCAAASSARASRAHKTADGVRERA